MPGKHTVKQKRQAKHVAASERKRGMSPKRAESIGWATVNKQKARKSFNVISLDEAYYQLRKDMGGEVKPQVSATPFQRRRAPKETVKMKPITNAEAAANLRAGKFHEKSLTLSLEELACAVKASGFGKRKSAFKPSVQRKRKLAERRAKAQAAKPPKTYANQMNATWRGSRKARRL